ncbi:DJ-1/PfpIfamilyprotein [Macrophomina phaseolina MS6]|uniref:DJ-1/PfpIfamilyprotein n=1 Tax=Macrophomina phaseolina (strain MS6) TaxID=1126212 RepID=K2S0T6_MACPH|nr:DJ-1/PfpIfamilyprotein [Macrophomina phaseolina MS6]
MGLLSIALTPTASADALEPRYTNSSLPLNYGMLLFPAFQALDVFGPLDALNILSWSHTMNLYLVRLHLSFVQYLVTIRTIRFARTIQSLFHERN